LSHLQALTTLVRALRGGATRRVTRAVRRFRFSTMRRYILFYLLVGITALSSCVPTTSNGWMATVPASSPATKQIHPTITAESTLEPYVLVDVTMYVRDGPGMEFNVIGEIESQKKYLVIGKHVDWWLLDIGNNQSGWVYAPAGETRFFGNASAIPDIASPPTPTLEIIAACTPASTTESASEGLEKARNALTTFFELLNRREYAEAAALYGGDYQGLRDSNPLVDPQDHVALLTNGCEKNGLQCLRVKRIIDETVVSVAEYHFTVEFMNQDESLFVRGPCCGGNATDFPPESQFAYTVIRNCAGEFLIVELPVYVP